MQKKKSKSVRKAGFPDFDAVCSCGSGEIAGACCKSNNPCPCGSGDKAGECHYAPENDDEE